MSYIDYYPQILKEISEIKILCSVLEPLFYGLNLHGQNLLNEFCLSTATEIGIGIWERSLGIEVTSTDLEIRRANVRSVLLGDKTSLRTKLNVLLGVGKWKMTVYPKECYIKFALDASVWNLKSAFVELIERVVPVNMTFEIMLAYNTHNDLAAYTHRYLSGYTHAQIRNINLEG